MAFSSSITESFPIGNRRMQVGTWTQAAGDYGGTITTGLGSNIDWFDIKFTSGNKDVSCVPSISAGTITIATTPASSTEGGVWVAIGH